MKKEQKLNNRRNTHHMTKITKFLLAISLIAFGLGFTHILWGFGMPVGAICFGLFMIFRILGKEAAKYDEEQRLRVAEAMRVSMEAPRTAAATPIVPLSAAVASSR